jgi:hypothetical protein
MKTIEEVMPKNSGTIISGKAPHKGFFQFNLNDGTSVNMEIEFWSAVTGEEAKKFRSANWTGCWINEATEVTVDVLSAASERVGRFPSLQGGGCSWSGILMDFNRPPRRHWLMSYFNKPELVLDGKTVKSIASFTQPPAAFKLTDSDGHVTYEANPLAENLENLDGGMDYYKGQIGLLQTVGHYEKIDALYCLLDADLKEGKAVFPTFKRETHVSTEKLEPLYYQPLIVGFDTSGIHPAAVFLQLQQGRWCVIDELCGYELGLETFLESALVPHLRNRYSRCESVTISCDPANARDSYTGLAPTTHLKQAGFIVTTPVTNKPETRIAAVATLLNKNYGGLLVSKHCETLIDALNGEYHYKKFRIMGAVESAYSARPEKNEASHIADALQYACLFINHSESQTSDDSVIGAKIAQRNELRRRILM